MPIELQKRPGRDKWYLMGTEFGENVRESTGTADLAKAKVILAKKRAEIFKRHAYGAQATCKFIDAATSYLEAGKGGKNKRHLHNLLYKDKDATILTEFAQKPLSEIDQTCLDALEKQHPGVSKATLLAYIYVPVTAVMRHAAKRKLCAVPNFDRPEPGKGRTDYLKPVNAEKLIAACSDHFRPFVVFLIGTGCRLSEALYLDWNEVDLDGGYAIIQGPTDEDDADYQTKNGNRRTVPLSPRVLAELRTLSGVEPASGDRLLDKLKRAHPKQPHRSGPVFRRPDGEAYARPDEQGRGGRHVHTALVGAAERAGLPHVHPHMCRHTFATWHSQMGTHQFKLMLLGGWSSVSMVKRYSHMDGMVSPADARIIASWIGGLEPHLMTKAAPALKVVGG